jgi:hypothetical protein
MIQPEFFLNSQRKLTGGLFKWLILAFELIYSGLDILDENDRQLFLKANVDRLFSKLCTFKVSGYQSNAPASGKILPNGFRALPPWNIVFQTIMLRAYLLFHCQQ